MHSAIHVARLLVCLGCIEVAVAARAYSLLSSGSWNSSEMSILPNFHGLVKVDKVPTKQEHPSALALTSEESRNAHVIEGPASTGALVDHVEKTFVHAERTMSLPAVIGGHSSEEHLEKTFSHVESVMSHPAAKLGLTGSVKTGEGSYLSGMTPKLGVHGMHSRVHQSFLSQLATRSRGFRRMSVLETVFAVVLVMTLIAMLTWGTACMVKVSTGRLTVG